MIEHAPLRREQRIISTFVELANNIVDDFDVIEFLHRVAERSVELLDCSEAGLLLVDAAGVLRVMASSSERADALELLQCQNDEGPCFECYHRGAVVMSAELSAELERWPTFVPSAVSKGFRSVHAMPMRVGGQTIGALNLFRSHTGELAEQDVLLGQGMADIAAIAVLQERVLRESRGVVAQLQGALTSRVLIEQAKGILAEQAHTTVDVAFTRLREYSRVHNCRLVDVARDLIEGRLNAATIATPVVPPDSLPVS